ncbi:hypothetical protein NAI58_09550, partial [Francisella tularensis subsp. holarctica]|nr:hypothetical protein [Francisella tularensis subsp. holarctica]
MMEFLLDIITFLQISFSTNIFRINYINPQCKVTALQTFINPDNSQDLLTLQNYDYVIDAIDTL